MPALLLALIPKNLRPVAKAVYAFVLPLAAQIILQVTQNGVTLGNAVRSVAVAAVIALAVHQAPNRRS
jgi:hypothetical protein